MTVRPYRFLPERTNPNSVSDLSLLTQRNLDRIANALANMDDRLEQSVASLTRIINNINITPGGSGDPVDLDDLVKSRAARRLGTTQFSYWSDPFMTRPGQPGSPWTDGHPVDQRVQNDFPSTLQVFSNAGYGYIIVDPSGAYPFTSEINTPSYWGIVDVTTPAYLFTRFQIAPDPGTGGPGGWDNTIMSFIIGMVDGETLDAVGIGISGGQDNFCGIGGDLLSASGLDGVPTAVPQDFNWHDMEIWTGDGAWHVSIDDGTPVDFSAAVNGTIKHATPIIQAMSIGVQQPAINVDHFAVVASRNLPVVSV